MCFLHLADKHLVKTNFFACMYICISSHFCVVASIILDQSFWFWFATNSVIHLSNLSLLVFFLRYHPRWHFCHLKARLLQLSPNGPHQPSSILSQFQLAHVLRVNPDTPHDWHLFSITMFPSPPRNTPAGHSMNCQGIHSSPRVSSELQSRACPQPWPSPLCLGHGWRTLHTWHGLFILVANQYTPCSSNSFRFLFLQWRFLWWASQAYGLIPSNPPHNI